MTNAFRTLAADSRLTMNFSGSPTTSAIVSISTCPNCGGGGPGTLTHDFGVVASPSTRSQFFFVTNSGIGTAQLTPAAVTGAATSIAIGTALSAAFGFGVTGSGAFPGGTGTKPFNGSSTIYSYCGPTLARGVQCLVTVNFHPGAAATRYTSAINLQYQDPVGALPNANRNIAGNSN